MLSSAHLRDLSVISLSLLTLQNIKLNSWHKNVNR